MKELWLLLWKWVCSLFREKEVPLFRGLFGVIDEEARETKLQNTARSKNTNVERLDMMRTGTDLFPFSFFSPSVPHDWDQCVMQASNTGKEVRRWGAATSQSCRNSPTASRSYVNVGFPCQAATRFSSFLLYQTVVN